MWMLTGTCHAVAHGRTDITLDLERIARFVWHRSFLALKGVPATANIMEDSPPITIQARGKSWQLGLSLN